MEKVIRAVLLIWGYGCGLLPAVILLVLHFVLRISLWWSVLAAGLWIVGILFRGLVVRWARYGSTPEPPKANKNPYSSRTER